MCLTESVVPRRKTAVALVDRHTCVRPCSQTAIQARMFNSRWPCGTVICEVHSCVDLEIRVRIVLKAFLAVLDDCADLGRQTNGTRPSRDIDLPAFILLLRRIFVLAPALREAFQIPNGAERCGGLPNMLVLGVANQALIAGVDQLARGQGASSRVRFTVR